MGMMKNPDGPVSKLPRVKAAHAVLQLRSLFIPGLLLLDLFSGVTGVSISGAGIAHFAHLGGAIGFLPMLLWRHRGPVGPALVPV